MGNNIQIEGKETKLQSTHSIASPHIMLSNCKVIFGNHQNFIQAEWPFSDKRQYDNWEKSYKQFLDSLFKVNEAQLITDQIANYLLLPHHYSYSNTNICTPTGVTVISYSFFQQPLIKDIQSRSHSNQPYSEQQIWIMLHELTSTASYMHERSKFLGDVRSENIFMNPQNKSIKIATEVSWIGERSLQSKYESGENLYITSQMALYLNKKGSLPFTASCSNDDFSIGMTIAECILLQDLSTIYQTKDQVRLINEQKHQQVIQNLLRIKYYPAKLLLIVVGMIQLQTSKRFSCQEVKNCLKTFKNSILMQDSFSLTKQHYSRFFNKKYLALDDLVSDYKTKSNQRMFKNGELSLSHVYTINDFSSVRMVKRTQNETFNLEIFDASNCTAKAYKKSQAESIINKSWSNNNQKSSVQKNKLEYSNILEKLSPSIYTSRVGCDKETSKQKDLKVGQYSTLASKFVESHVKQIEEDTMKSNINTASPLPITNFNEVSSIPCSPELKIFQENDQIVHNFSFHSPESRIEQKFKYQIPQHDEPNKLSRNSSSVESLVMPSLYHLSQPPSSYVSYQYSKTSFTNPQKSITQISPMKSSNTNDLRSGGAYFGGSLRENDSTRVGINLQGSV